MSPSQRTSKPPHAALPIPRDGRCDAAAAVLVLQIGRYGLVVQHAVVKAKLAAKIKVRNDALDGIPNQLGVQREGDMWNGLNLNQI